MLTHFDHEEWQKFREDCEFYAWQAEELSQACEKALLIITRRFDGEERSDVVTAMRELHNEYAALIADLRAMQHQLELCDRDAPSDAGEKNIGVAACAIRKLTTWPPKSKPQPIEYSHENAPDNVGVWRIHFSRD